MSRCPSASELEGMLEERLAEPEFESISLHVSECAGCQATLEQLTAETQVRSGNSHLSVKSRATSAVSNPFLESLKGPSVFAKLTALPAPAINQVVPQNSSDGDSSNKFPQVSGYEIVDELGRGGMGVVYLAKQTGLGRLVALKMILAGAHANEKDLARFRQEAEAVARLRHPNIVQIHDIGESDGIPYFALEYVEEGNLGTRIRGKPQELESAARMVETLARAIYFTHQRGIVHRDLKPANILLAGEPFEVRDSGGRQQSLQGSQPKITDFGLAKRLDADSSGRYSGDIVGTPSYMAPEQAGSKGHLVGPESDVYSLGAILYEMLTARPPFKGATPLDTVIQVLHDEPVRPSRIRPERTARSGNDLSEVPEQGSRASLCERRGAGRRPVSFPQRRADHRPAGQVSRAHLEGRAPPSRDRVAARGNLA